LRSFSLRAASAAPAERGDAVGAPEGPHEVAHISVVNPPADLLYRKVGLSTNRRRASALLYGVGDDAAYMVSRIAEQIPRRAIMEENKPEPRRHQIVSREGCQCEGVRELEGSSPVLIDGYPRELAVWRATRLSGHRL
jgi:hypothetical protein